MVRDWFDYGAVVQLRLCLNTRNILDNINLHKKRLHPIESGGGGTTKV